MSEPIHVTTEDFQSQVLESSEPVVVDFWAPWCGPCKAIGPVLEQLAEQYDGQVKVAKVNVDDEPALAGAFKVSGIPTLYVIEEGKVLGQMVGFGGKQMLEDLFAKLQSGELRAEIEAKEAELEKQEKQERAANAN